MLGYDNEDVMKLVVLYFAHNGLMGGNTKKVNLDQFIHLANNLDAFSRHLWEFIVWNAMTKSMWRAIHMRYKHMMKNYPSFILIPPFINYSLMGYTMGY